MERCLLICKGFGFPESFHKHLSNEALNKVQHFLYIIKHCQSGRSLGVISKYRIYDIF